MRSPADHARNALEWSLRAVSVALLATMLWSALHASRSSVGTDTAAERDLTADLPRWTADARLHALHVQLDTAPDAVHRDWLRALRRAGTAVEWSSDSSIRATAIDVERVMDPAGGALVRVAAPRGSTIRVGDALGPIDSAHSARAGATFMLPVLDGVADGLVGRQHARARAGDSLGTRSLVLLGAAGWESKFVMAALEERGWHISARLHVSPIVSVTQGEPAVLDTARVAAVIALDSSAAPDAERIVRFVREGGGLILGPDAARLRPLAAIAPAAPGARIRPATISFTASAPRRALAFTSLVAPRTDAVALEVRDGQLAVAARREATGRVLETGYDESWRWRMLGDASAPAAHRAWWASLVASVAYRPAIRTERDGHEDGAPLAHLLDALGPPRSASRATADSLRAPALRGWMLIALLACLLAEWASRRLRGRA